MFLRFSTTHAHPESGLEAGILWAAYRLRERGDLTLAEEEELAATLARLEAALPTPTKFSRTGNASHRNTHGLSWVKSTATDIVADLHKLADILRRHGIAVEVAKTDRPGYVVYEDEWQVVAEPFHGERI